MTKTTLQRSLCIHNGSPFPLGAYWKCNSWNFALFSTAAHRVHLCLFEPNSQTPIQEIPLDPDIHKTGMVWHIEIENLPKNTRYAYRIQNKEREPFSQYLLDPYAKSLATHSNWGALHPSQHSDKEAYKLENTLAILPDTTSFNWEGDQVLQIPFKDLIIYETHVRGLTQDPSSLCKYRGSFKGIIEKISYLKSLGINAVELLPVFEFNENEYPKQDPETGEALFNYWGYSTMNFFTPMRRFAVGNEDHSPINEFKTMVKELHRAGISVILDVVFNHSSEGGDEGPVHGMKGLAPNVYYLKDSDGNFANYSGCGNTLNANHPTVREMIKSAVRYWVSEMHVDGFRFDLASALTRGVDGEPLSHPPLIEDLALDPALQNTHLIAEAWDAAGLYQVGSFPAWDRWSEWNGRYRDSIRQFIKGTPSHVNEFACRLSGSQDLYHHRKHPWHGINFVTAHDGFSLYDLVSYNEKHNLSNCEDNRDGCNDNISWNCGHEGSTEDLAILNLRNRQVRNFHLALMCSQGVPMMTMGDEYGHSKEGNNNTWCHDRRNNWFQWDVMEKQQGLVRFFSLVNQFRRETPLFRRDSFLTEKDIDWHGWHPLQPDWGHESRFIAFTLKDLDGIGRIYVAFNASFEHAQIQVPDAPPFHEWHRVFDTSKSSPEDAFDCRSTLPIKNHAIHMLPHSSLVLEARAEGKHVYAN